MQKLIFVNILLLILSSGNLLAQWQQIHGPSRATANDISNYEDDFYLGSRGGLFQLNDEKTEWEKIINPLLKNIIQIEVNETDIYSIVDNSYSSISRGDLLVKGDKQSGVWSKILGSDSLKVEKFLINKDTLLVFGDKVLVSSGNVVGSRGEVYRSFDGGNSWEKIAFFDPSVIAQTSQGLFMSNNKDDKIYHSTDWGITWTDINPGNQFSPFKLYAVGSKVIASNSNFGNFILNDTLGWNTLRVKDFFSSSLKTFFGIDNYLYTFNQEDNSFYLSKDFGVTWNSLGSNAFYTNYSVSEKTIIGYASNHVFISDNGSFEAQPISLGLGSAFETRFVSVNDAGIFASDYSKGNFSTDGGLTWNNAGGGRPNYVTQYDGKFWYTESGSLWYSNNDGTEWTKSFLGYNSARALAAEHEKLVMSRGIFISYITIDETGNLSDSFPNLTNLNTITSIATNDSITVVSDVFNDVVLTFDDGVSWSNITNNLPNFLPFSNNFCVEIKNGQVFGLNTALSPLVKYDFSTKLWEAVQLPEDITEHQVVFLEQFEDAIFIGFANKGIYLTYDLEHWLNINGNISHLNVSSLAFHDDSLYLGINGNAIWKQSFVNLPDVVTAIEDQPLNKKNKLILFPNPTSTNKIQITLTSGQSKSSKGIISIYNIAGQLLQKEPVIIKSTIELSIARIPKGFYFIQLATKEGSVSGNFVKLN